MLATHSLSTAAAAIWPRLASPRHLGLVLVSSLLMALMSGCGGGSNSAPPATEGQATVSALGGTIKGPDGVSIELPVGALSTTATVRIARDSAGAPGIAEHLVALTPVYSVTPHIPALGQPATVSLPIDTSKLDPNAPPPVVMVASPGGDWEVLPTEPVQGGIIKAHSAHFSYVVAVQIPAGFVTADVVLPDALKPPPGYPVNAIYIKARQAFTGTVNLTVPSKAFDQTTGNWYCRTPMTITINLVFRDRSGKVVKLVPKTLGPFTSAANATYTFSIDDSLNGYAQLQLIQNCQLTFPPHTGVHGFGGGVIIWGAVNFDVDIPQPAGAPVIAFQPEAVSVLVGGPASFSVTASASGQLQGRWFRSDDGGKTWVDTNISGTVLNLPATTLADDGALFRVNLCNIINGQQICIDSAPAALHVVPAVVAPGVVVSPSSLDAVVGQTASITAIATGAPAPRLAIYRVGNATPVQDCHATNPCSYTTPTGLALSDDGAQFYAQAVTPGHVFGESGYSATSNTSTVHVAAHFAAPGITTPPQSFRSTVGGTASFSVQAGGTSPLSYRWLLNGVPLSDHAAGATTSGVVGATSAALTLSNVQAADAGNYSVEVSNGTLPNAISQSAVLTVPVPTLSAVALAANIYNTCAARPDGSVACWGDNGHGQIGNGSAISATSPATVAGVSGAVGVAVGQLHSCAQKADGTVLCWGYNLSGQLGDGTTVDRPNAAPVSGLSDVLTLAAGLDNNCAVKSDGTQSCWGYNEYGQLGDGGSVNQLSPISVTGLADATATGMGWFHTCTVKSGGSVVCWGRNDLYELGDTSIGFVSRTPVVVPSLIGVMKLASGLYHNCAARTDGSVVCWGQNDFGELGNGSTSLKAGPAAVAGLTDVVALAAGFSHTCALKSDGTVACWGYNGYGQLGDGTTTDRLVPTAVPGLAGVVALAAGGYHTCALKADGGVLCWGWNGKGQLGDGTTADKHSPTPVAF